MFDDDGKCYACVLPNQLSPAPCSEDSTPSVRALSEPCLSVIWVLKPKYQYRDHLVGQLTNQNLAHNKVQNPW